MNKRMREAIRYLGYGRHAVDEQTLSLISKSFEDLESVIVKKSIYRIFEVEHKQDHFSLGKIDIYSKNLQKNLKGCNQIAVFAATLGPQTDIYLNKYSITNVAKALILQACAAALLEEYCDTCQDKIAESLKAENYYLRPRFSPGYGDFDITYQQPLMQILDCAKKIGVTMTDHYMLSPIKSVTAIIGITDQETPCHKSGCEVCIKMDCQFRRDVL